MSDDEVRAAYNSESAHTLVGMEWFRRSFIGGLAIAATGKSSA
jgi:hypothetical protein